MRKLKDTLRLRAAGLTIRQISANLRISVGVVSKYLAIASRAGLTWPLPDHIDDAALEQEADRFVAAMREHKKPVTYVLYPDEPHDLRLPESWVSFFAIAERFFHEHLGGRYEPIGDDLRGGLEVRAGGELIPGLSAAMDRRARAEN